jgi:hypothetical protein
MARTDLDQLLAAIDQAYDRKSWHGTNLRGSILRVSPELAAWRPGPGRHNIHELVVHAAYWKYTVLRRLSGARRGSFPLPGSNWFEREGPDEAAWRGDVALLGRIHKELRAAVAALSPHMLTRNLPSSKVTRAWLISGIAAHDLYHAGQIQLIRKLHTPNR